MRERAVQRAPTNNSKHFAMVLSFYALENPPTSFHPLPHILPAGQRAILRTRARKTNGGGRGRGGGRGGRGRGEGRGEGGGGRRRRRRRSLGTLKEKRRGQADKKARRGQDCPSTLSQLPLHLLLTCEVERVRHALMLPSPQGRHWLRVH